MLRTSVSARAVAQIIKEYEIIKPKYHGGKKKCLHQAEVRQTDSGFQRKCLQHRKFLQYFCTSKRIIRSKIVKKNKNEHQ